ncbi:MAG: hypothetical protein WBF53_07900, partial [Litorimonas sp.]
KKEDPPAPETPAPAATEARFSGLEEGTLLVAEHLAALSAKIDELSQRLSATPSAAPARPVVTGQDATLTDC